MSKFPDSVLTTTKKGEVEARMLIDRGKFVRYRYVDAETGAEKDGGKVKLVLIPENGGAEEFFVIPTKGGRSLLLKAEVKGERMLWDGEKAVKL
jgi:hypothetical protein